MKIEIKTHIRRVVSVAIPAAMAFSFPVRAEGAPDLDGDGIPNIVDPDVDNDGIPNALDRNIDGGVALSGPFEGQYIGDHVDNDNPAEDDIDGDGLADDSLGENDIDGDGSNDNSSDEMDIDGDQRVDDSPAERDIDGDGRNDDNPSEDDIDGDSLNDDDIDERDIDGDGQIDDVDGDIDGDGRSNDDSSENDIDGDGRGNNDDDERNDDGDSMNDRDDSDDNNNGVRDIDELNHHSDDDELEVEVTLTRVAAPSDSRCRVKIQRMASGEIEFEVDGRDRSGLMVAGNYEIVIDGVVRGYFPLLDDGGDLEGEVEFETFPDDAEELPLDFDVIGLPIEIRKDGVVYFAGTVPTPLDPPVGSGAGEPLLGSLTPVEGLPAGARANVEIGFGPLGPDELEIELEDMIPGDYGVIVGETNRGTITVTIGGRGEIKFDSNPNDPGEILLEFNPAGQPVVIVDVNGAVVFSGNLPGGTVDPGGNGGGDGADDNGGNTGGLAGGALTPAAGLSPEANANVEVQFGIAGAIGLEVEVEDIPAGDYDLVVGDTVRGVITVADDGNGTRGKIKFEAVPNASQLLLDFIATGQTIEIRQGDTVFFSGVTPDAPLAP